ncbi:MAG: 7-carboxy-7-deazaguanine synthase QueE [Veillonellales bacterium]
MRETSYPVIEVFESIQGEGAHMGLGADFIRLAGCNLRCPWCDTSQAFNVENVRTYIAEELLQAYPFNQPMVVITGGEPTLHDLGPLVAGLHRRGKYVAIETNGTRDVPEEWQVDWVTVSPKPPEYAIHCRADELKYIVDDGFELRHIQRDKAADGKIFLQVESCRPESAVKAYAMIIKNPRLHLRLGIQLHKIVGVE